MRISKILLATVLSCCVVGSLSAAVPSKQMKRHYIREQNVRMTKDGIAIKAKGKIILTKTIHHDRKGLYVFRKDCEAVSKGWEENGWTDGTVFCQDCDWGFRDQQAFDHYHEINPHDNDSNR